MCSRLRRRGSCPREPRRERGRRDERARGPAAAIDLAVEVDQARGSRTRPRELVDLGHRHLFGQRLEGGDGGSALSRGQLAVASGDMAVVGGRDALFGCARPSLGGF